MKFVMTQSLCEEGLRMLEEKADYYVAGQGDPSRYLDQMEDADGLIVRIGSCSRAVIESSPRLKVIGRTGIGYDSVDVKAASERGIPVVITPGANSRSVAEHTVALMFALAKNIVEGHNETRKGNWEIRGAGKAFELEGKTVGIIGMGSIGREVCKICRGCGMEVIAYDTYFTPEQLSQLGAEACGSLNILLKKADIVTVHMPLVEATKNLIGEQELKQMKPESVLINTSRGGIVEESALIRALRERWIAGAGIDVYCQEPPEAGDPLLDCPNLILSPHAAAQTKEAVIKMAQMCVEGCLAVCRGERWPYVADPSVYDHPKWK